MLASISKRLTVAMAAATLAAAGAPAPAFAAVGDISEYAVPTANSRPSYIALGPDGNIWFTEESANQVGKITPVGSITEYPIPSAGPGTSEFPSGITAGPDGNIWITVDISGPNGGLGKIAKITPGGTFTEYDIPKPDAQNPGPEDITSGPDGNLWFDEGDGQFVGKVTTAGAITMYAASGGETIVTGPDGNLWYADGSQATHRIDTSGNATTFTVPNPSATAGVEGLTVGPDGNLWASEDDRSKIAKLTAAGVYTEYDIPQPNAKAESITQGQDGNLWFVEDDTTSNGISRISTAGSFFTPFSVPTASARPWHITAGPDCNVWFTERDGNKIGKVVSGGVTTVTSVFPATANPGDTLTVRGTNFLGGTAVAFGSTPATNFKIFNDTTLTAVVPAGSGTTDIHVSAPCGVSAVSAADAFRFAPNLPTAGVGTESQVPMVWFLLAGLLMLGVAHRLRPWQALAARTRSLTHRPNSR